MALDTVPLTRQRLVAAALETTTGTAVAFADGNSIPLFFDAALVGQTDVVERPAQGTLTRLVPVPGARGGRFPGRCELMGSGTGTLPRYVTTLMVACGMANATGVLTPLT